MNKEFNGIYAALVTPYTPENTVNHGVLAEHVNRLLDRGIDGFYVSGSSAETFLLRDDERRQALKTIVEANAGRGKVICHVGAISTDAAVDYARYAQTVGVDAISAISPFYYKFSKAEIVNYYKDIMAATDLPMFVYNFPNQSGFAVTEDVVDALQEAGNLAGIKYTSSDFFLMERIKTKHPELVMWNGFDEMLLCGLTMGADGGIGSTYNCIPHLIRKVYDSYRAGDLAAAERWQKHTNYVIEAICKYGVFASIKTILGFEGLDFGGCRKPFSPISEEGEKELREIYESYIRGV